MLAHRTVANLIDRHPGAEQAEARMSEPAAVAIGFGLFFRVA